MTPHALPEVQLQLNGKTVESDHHDSNDEGLGYRDLREGETGYCDPNESEPEDHDPNHLVRGKDFSNLRRLLTCLKVEHADKTNHFWPDRLLRQIMTQERVKEEFEAIKGDVELWGHGVTWYLDKLFPCPDPDVENGVDNGIESAATPRVSKRYLKIYTILVLINQQRRLRSFIDASISDEDLPFLKSKELNPHKFSPFRLALKSDLSIEVSCLQEWDEFDVENFYREQDRVLTPFLSLETPVSHVQFYDKCILPWMEEGLGQEGGYGMVTSVKIHPTSHGFHNVDQVKHGCKLFALKKMTSPKIKDFENETKMLRMFSGHHHLIRLLMSFSWKGNNYLLFPWAEKDLEAYWSDKSPPYDALGERMDAGSMSWISKQILGMTSALHSIHNPKQPASLDKADLRYGRHGDLKAENILWLKGLGCTGGRDGILVIGDLGISAVHRVVSRSNQPNQKIPHTPDYRPPECDLEGGKISRAFDIWTLGCLFLEMVCWILGGPSLRTDFTTARENVPYLGANYFTSIFFDIQITEDSHYVVLVKDVVHGWILKLHNHLGCTEYLHELLDLIQKEMIIVESKDKERIRSGPLLRRVEAMHQKAKNSDYSQAPCPERRKREFRVGVQTELNKHAMKRVKGGAQLEVFKGAISYSKAVQEMKNIDK